MLQYLHKRLKDFNFKMLIMINKERSFFQYKSADLAYIISPLTSQLRTSSMKVAIKYIGPLVIYKVIDPHNYLLMILDGYILQGLFEHERLKPTILRTSQDSFSNLSQRKQMMNVGIGVSKGFPSSSRAEI